MKNFSDDLATAGLRAPQQRGGNFGPSFEFDYTSLLRRLRRNWYWFVLAAIAGATAAYLMLRYETPIYSASATILVEEKGGGGAGVSQEAIASEFGFATNYVIDNELYVLQSQILMERVVNILGLDVRYQHIGRIRDTEIYEPDHFRLLPADTLFLATSGERVSYGSIQVRLENPNQFSLIRGEGDTVLTRYGENFNIGNRRFNLLLTDPLGTDFNDDIYKVDVMDPAQVAARYVNKLNVEQVGRSSVVDLRITDPVREKARDILNTLVEVYGDQIIERQRKTGEKTLSFIDERLNFVTQELYEVEGNVAGLKRDRGMSVSLEARGADFLNQLNVADAQLAELEVRRDFIESIRENLLANPEGFEPLPVTSEIISGILAEQILQYNNLIFERDQGLESFTPEHPSMATYIEQLNNLRRNILRSINTSLRETNKRIEGVRARIEPITQDMNRIPDDQRQLVQIMRQQQIKQDLFVYLLQRREEAALTVAAQVTNTQVVDRATASPAPISPNKQIRYIFAVGLALMIPTLSIFVAELTSTRVGTEEEVTRRFNAPVIGRIINSGKVESMVVQESDHSGITETFRLLRTNLNFSLPKATSSVLLVTSGVGGDGKSFVSANLARSLSLAKKKVILVGMDLRKPKLAGLVLGKSLDRNAPGLSTYLSDRAEYENIVKETGYEGLWIIPSGPVPPNPGELLLEDRFGELIQRLREEFDVIIIDSPPVGIVADALTIKDHIDLTLYVVRVGKTPKKSLTIGQEVQRSGSLPRMNLVLNGINSKESYGYSYGYYE